MKCVHTEHCCFEHGCKYGDKGCPVWLGLEPQSYLCEYCEDGMPIIDEENAKIRRIEQSIPDFYDNYRNDKLASKTIANEIFAKITPMQVADVCANLLSKYECGSLDLRWTAEKFWGKKLTELLPRLNKCYTELVKYPEKLNFNDLDDNVWAIKDLECKVIAHTMQNVNMLYVWQQDGLPKFQQLHIRRFWDKYPLDSEEAAELKQELTLQKAIKDAKYFSQFADDYPDELHPERPSLETYIVNGFKMKYGDCRDKGYIASLNTFSEIVDNAGENHEVLSLVVTCFVSSWETVLNHA